MNMHVVIGTEEPQRLPFFDRPRVGEHITVPDGRTVIIQSVVHDLIAARFVLKCTGPALAKAVAAPPVEEPVAEAAAPKRWTGRKK